MKKLITISFLLALFMSNAYAQKKISFKTTEGKKVKLTIPGKLVTTYNNTGGGKEEYYVLFDATNQQVVISMVSYSDKGYLGSDILYCKYDSFHKMFLKNIQLQELDVTGKLNIEKLYSYTLTAKEKFKLVSTNSFTGTPTEGEDGNAVIRFANKETAESFLKELKQNVGE